MGALPKRKISRKRRDERRSHDALTPTELVACKDCGSFRQSHHVCPSCGRYNGKQVINVK